MQIVCSVVVIAIMTGCASTKTYFADRGRDALDIFTLTAEQGVGVTVHAGPVSTGLGIMGPTAGLDGGTLVSFKDQAESELQLLVFGFDAFKSPNATRYKERGGCQFLCIQDPTAPLSFSFGSHDVNPFKSLPLDLYPPTWVEHPGITQFEVSLAAGVGIRVGFNVMELVDFVCGWTTLDILGDDSYRKKLKEESNKESRAPVNPHFSSGVR